MKDTIKTMSYVTLEYRKDGEYPEHRKCAICDKTETREQGDWK